MAGRESFRPTAGDRGRFTEVPGSDSYPDEVVVNLDDKNVDNFEIVTEDDTPEDDRGRPNAKRNTADDEENFDGVSDRTVKRINRLKFETNSERRKREDAERQLAEAAKLITDRDAEIADLRRRTDSGNVALAKSMQSEREALIADGTRRLEQAHADGDSAAIAKATTDISAAQAELIAIKSRAPRPKDPADEQRREAAPPQNNQPTLAPNVKQWIDHNAAWFNKDQAKTNKAMSVHYDLIADGIAPTSDKYTQELDKRMRKAYPDHRPMYESDDGDRSEQRREAPRRSNNVAEGGREETVRQPSRQVILTNTELALAKRLGVSAQAYAVEKAKRDAREKGEGAR